MIGRTNLLGANLPTAIGLKPYLTPSSRDFQDIISFQEIPGKPGTFLVVEKAGGMYTYIPQTGQTSPWNKIDVNTLYEEGLYTIAFHPDFIHNGKYYLFYSPKENEGVPFLNYGHPGQFVETLAEFIADPNHEKDSGKDRKIIANFCCKDGPGHNGMYMVFGKDGMLYLSVGDGNSDGRETQSKHTFLGTILRLDIDHADAGKNYGIPKDNPFVNETDNSVHKEIWAFGFRNSFKLSLDLLNGNLWVGNVGGWNEDHISLVKKAGNYGWPITEGTVCFDNSKTMFQYTAPLDTCNRKGIIPPTIPVPHSYPRSNVNTNCVIGPIIYRGNPSSPLYGSVFFADFTAQQLFAARLDSNNILIEKKEYAKPPMQIIHIQESTDGHILVCGLASKQFYYLDHPDLLMGHVNGIHAKHAFKGSVKHEQYYFNLLGKVFGKNTLN